MSSDSRLGEHALSVRLCRRDDISNFQDNITPLLKFFRIEIKLFQFPAKCSIFVLSMALHKTAQKIKLSRFSLSGPLMTAPNCG